MCGDFGINFNKKYRLFLKKQYKSSTDKTENHKDSVIANSRFRLIFQADFFEFVWLFIEFIRLIRLFDFDIF